ncbi:MAG TPA: PilX N-terminal domain-containing pilus assembly protein, partial [Terriglobales bacterium]|nr:PilX N-terminal domain-containing pilus assembly protein [Terriglobales bacterium]
MNKKTSSRGFTLIAALLLLTLMSAISIGLFMMVTTETKVGGGDVQNNLAFHNAEGAIEMMNSQLANSFQNIQAP